MFILDSFKSCMDKIDFAQLKPLESPKSFNLKSSKLSKAA